MNRDCCNKPNGKKSIRGGSDPFIMWIVIITVFILALSIYFGMKSGGTTQVGTNTQVTLSIDKKTYDWGTIDYDGGIVSKSFNIKNTSNSVLKIYGVKTSCMCTTAQLKTSELSSRKYGMHEKISDIFEVKPGKTAQLLIEFDPAFHGPSGVGPITRTITMSTNDSKNSTVTFNLYGTVVKK